MPDLADAVLTRPTTGIGGRPQLARAARATGYSRIGIGALAAGPFGGQPGRLVLPVERVLAADLRVRLGGTALNVAVNGPAAAAAIAQASARLIAAEAGVEAAELLLSLRMPLKSDAGTDVLESAAIAVIDAVTKALEVPLAPSRRAALVAEVLGGRAGGLTAGGPAIVGADGTALARPTHVSRLLLLLAQPGDGGDDAAAVADDACYGQLVVPSDNLSDPAALAAWLVACSGSGTHHAAMALHQVCSENPEVLGVVGGHTPNAPVAALLAPNALSASQRLSFQLTSRLPAGWRSSVTRTAAC